MKMIAAWVQVIFVLLIIGYGTWQLFDGHFQESFVTLSLLFAYCIFLIEYSEREEKFAPERICSATLGTRICRSAWTENPAALCQPEAGTAKCP